MTTAMDINLMRMQQLRGQHVPRQNRQLPAATLAPTPPAVRPILLRPAVVAKMLGITEKTLRGWPIPRFTFNRVVGYREEDIKAFISSRTYGQPLEVKNG